jgi:hypothetical protein
MSLGALVSSTVQSFLHRWLCSPHPDSPAAPRLGGSPPMPCPHRGISEKTWAHGWGTKQSYFLGFLYLIRLERAEIAGVTKRTSSKSTTKLALNININFNLWLQTLKGCLRGRLAEWHGWNGRPKVWMMDTSSIVGHSLVGQWSWRITG